MTAFDMLNRFQPYLMPGERVLWSGQSKQGIAFGARDAYLVPMSLLWGGFVIVWNVMVWTMPGAHGGGPDWLFSLWGLPFLVIGLYLIAGRFWHDAQIRKNLFYAVTDKRILVLRKSNFTSLDIDRLPRLELSEYRDGTGTLAFEPAGFAGPWGGRYGFSWWVPSLAATAQFFRIDHPRQVYELIRNQAHS